MRRFCIGALVAAIPAAVLLLAIDAARADSPGKLVSKGNASYGKGDYEKAVEYYEKASVRIPESPVIIFNLGDAFFRKEDFQKAREYFEEAALKSRDLSLEAKAWYNMGNSAFRQGARQLDSDMQKALEFYQESVQYYATALEKDPDLADAAHNMEVARLVIKDLLDRIKKQQEQMQKQQERLKEVVDSLLALIEREDAAVQLSDSLYQEPAKLTEAWKDAVEGIKKKQEGIMNGTEDVQGKLRELFADTIPPNVQQASSHLDSSIVDQVDALNDLASQSPGEAREDQQSALEQMKRALAALTQGEQQPQQGPGDNKQQEQQQQPQQQEKDQEAVANEKRDETARGILEEEEDNKKRRKEHMRQGYKAVDKDW
jgi:tetratricopeptide (TPR) repeat protein